MLILCVAEKNSIAKEVSRILSGGRSQTSDSGYKFIKNYKFKFKFPQYGNCDVVMTSVAGHLSGIDFPQNYAWNQCVPGKLFDAPVMETYSEDQKKIAKNIENLARNCGKLMIWTDCDREGEYIGWEILQAARKGNAALTLDNTWRAQFSHLELRHVLHAAKNAGKLQKPSIDAVRTRMELDLRTGAAFTRFLTDTFKSHNRNEDVGIVSYGPCQFPTLGFVVDRYKRYKNFKPEEFWYIEITVSKGSVEKLKLSWKRNRFFDRLSTLVLFKKCLESNHGTINKIETKPTTKYKPLPLTTVQLQKCCSLYFKMSAKESLDAAERLYQQGLISYPRTETDKFPDSLDLKEVLSHHTNNMRWGPYVRTLLESNRFTQPRKGNHDDEAHPPIYPIQYSDQITKPTDKKVYEFIVHHFIACCSQDAKGQLNSIELKWGSEIFTTSGLLVFERNFLEIYPYQKWENSTELPVFEFDEQVPIQTADMKSGKTSPPSLMTETELIALMDANGIGTDATIAEHIEKIISREYITKLMRNRRQCFVPTILGMSLVEGFEDLNLKNSLTKPFLRKHTELELKQIADGEKTKIGVCDEMLFLYRDSFAMSVRHSNLITSSYDKFKREIS